MTYTEKATQKSIEGGWKPRGVDIKEWSSFKNMMSLIPWHELTSDPLFWQSLGKAEGDGVSERGTPTVSVMSYHGKMMYSWQVRWHRFIDHLASSQDAESFFKSILTK